MPRFSNLGLAHTRTATAVVPVVTPDDHPASGLLRALQAELVGGVVGVAAGRAQGRVEQRIPVGE